MKRYVVLDKTVGQTPLECLEEYRSTQPELTGVPMAYAGRLDPMASGKLLVLIGEECKHQTKYHGLDKAYTFEVLFDVSSDSGDVLGLAKEATAHSENTEELPGVVKTLRGEISFPYPTFSSKPVQGKPLHTWAVEGRLSEIEIPSYTATIHQLKLIKTITKTRSEIYREVSEKIETIPPVTDPRKALGNDFRRPEVRASWNTFHEARTQNDTFLIATFSCVGSSGLYMRTLAEEIAKRCNTSGLAYSIHRTHIGQYQALPFGLGFWKRSY